MRPRHLRPKEEGRLLTKILDVLYPTTPEEALTLYKEDENTVFAAGGGGLRKKDASGRRIIALSELGLDYIRDEEEELVIGATTALAALEQSAAVESMCKGLHCCFHDIYDKSVKKRATAGGVVSGKHPFSILLPVLLTLTVDVVLAGRGRMSLENYLLCPPVRDLICEIRILKEKIHVSYEVLRPLPSDEPVLVAAVSLSSRGWNIVVGGRPGIAAIAHNAVAELNEKGIKAKDNVAVMVRDELDFADFGAASETERKEMTVAMLKRLLLLVYEEFGKLGYTAI